MLWRWWVAPTFHLPVLTMAQAMGVGLTGVAILGLSNLSRNKSDDDERDSKDQVISACIKVIVGPAVLLLVGYLLRFLTL